LICLLSATGALANIPGGGTGTGPNVTLVDNGGTVTMGNGIVSIVCTKSSAVLSQINYIYNNGGGTVTNQLLNGGKDGGEFYWENGGFGSGTFAYSVVASSGDYAEIDLLSTSTTNGVMDVHFSMLRGSPGFYVAPIWSHRNGDVAMGTGEERDNIYLSPEFAWNSIDATRNFQYNVGGSAVGVFGAPVEVSLWTNGISQGRYEDKYKYVADFGTERVWGWSSVNNPAGGFTGQNIGIWHILASVEYYNGGPMKPELMDAPMVNMINGGHYQMGSDSNFGANEQWTRVSGPYFIYCNNITNTITNAFQAANALFADAQAQAAAEQTAWPYSWFTNANYTPASGRGAVTGQFVINDSGNPNASAANLWVGVVQQPITIDGVYDFQQWEKPYQFWVKSDTNGNFTIPNVIAGTNYTLWAFGPGAAGTFMSQNQSGGNPPLLYNLPSVPFSVTVTGGATNNLGTITWTPSRVGSTVFEIGYPDRTARKFRHGEDWWVGDIGPSPTAPSPIWSKFLEYPFDFPNGPNYVVGQSRWSTDWNFCQPIVTDSSGNYNPSTSTITFNLAQAPANNSEASLYLGIASDYYGPLIVSVNGNNLGSTPGATATPSTNSSTGFTPSYSMSDTTIREGINAPFSDERLTFPGSLLQQGTNTITINMRKGGYFANHAMYDYLRLELTGYVPPAPASVAAYAGNNCNLISWPVTPGATSYNILSTATSGSNYTAVASNVIGPVCGSGTNNATYLDTNAVNGATYYYVVQSVNPTGTSTNSAESPGAVPSSGVSTNPPAAPTGLSATVGHSTATLTWSGSPGANYYTIQRSTLVDTLGGASNTLGTITLNNAITGTTYTDTSPNDGSIYSYFVTATAAGGTSSNSIPVVAVPIPPAPANPPSGITVTAGAGQTNNVISWSAVPGAVGYILERATSPGGPFTYVMSITETTYTDTGLSGSSAYYYSVAAVNAGGITNSTVIAGPPGIPATLGATAGDAQVLLNWAASPGATSYILKRGFSSGSETTLATGITSTSYTDTNVVNGTTYYYVVAASGPGGTSLNSPEASATPSGSTVAGLVWSGAAGSAWDTTTTNWLLGLTATVYSNGDNVTFNDSGASATVAITNAVSPGAVTFANSTVSYTVTNVLAGISGAASLVKSNAGTVTLGGPNSNSYTGGTTVAGGQLVFSVGAAIPASGTVTLTGTGAVTVISASPLTNVAVNGTNTITGNGNSGTGIATLNNAGVLNLAVSGGSKVFDLTGSMTGSGTLALATSGMTLRFNGTAGDGSAIFNLGTGTAVANVRATITTAIALGGLTGGSGTQLQGDNSAGGDNMRYTIGGANANTEFDGIIKDGTVGTVAITKTGTGTLTLTSTNFYSGGTTVSNGTLLVNNTSGSGTGSGSVTVNGGTLSGTGVIAGSVTVNSGGALSPGNPLGTLTISNSLVVNSGGVLAYDLGTNSALTVVSSNLTLGGTLNVSNAGGFGAGTYELFGYGKTLTYNGIGLGNAPVGYNYAINTNTSGQVSLVVTVPLGAFQQWQMNYFGCTNCAQAAPDADPLGKGISNTNQFLLGLNPTNPASVFRILSAVQQTTDVVITWAAGAGRTNVVQATDGDANGGYTNNFTDISGLIILSGSGDVTNSYTDVGGATYIPSRYYRIRLGP
jgi:autotransporter-associated beta strand protein